MKMIQDDQILSSNFQGHLSGTLISLVTESPKEGNWEKRKKSSRPLAHLPTAHRHLAIG